MRPGAAATGTAEPPARAEVRAPGRPGSRVAPERGGIAAGSPGAGRRGVRASAESDEGLACPAPVRRAPSAGGIAGRRPLTREGVAGRAGRAAPAPPDPTGVAPSVVGRRPLSDGEKLGGTLRSCAEGSSGRRATISRRPR
ncbi:hypothetical protein [Cellulomonas denverensis]|uniref:hypothetical protein n=1 Tax=Cellulomonas denverensis TaxID=264297 RepID=UPI001A40015C|nr:hypothetical protein Cde04nite_22190 [Cellulomonas denverensis]